MFTLHVIINKTKTWVHSVLMAMRYQHGIAMKGFTETKGQHCHKNMQIATSHLQPWPGN